jgi:NADPH:quinone reductase
MESFLHLGMEAVGVVTAVGPGLTGRKVGDVVGYAGRPIGSYSEEQILPASAVVPVPPSVDYSVAASVLLKGMTAHMLLRRVFKVLFYFLYFVWCFFPAFVCLWSWLV